MPLFSEFFVAVLEAYGVHMLHLHLNVVMLLAIFAYAYETFVEVMSSVALFRHFFCPRVGRSKWIAGGVSFSLWRDVEHEFSELYTHAD